MAAFFKIAPSSDAAYFPLARFIDLTFPRFHQMPVSLCLQTEMYSVNHRASIAKPYWMCGQFRSRQLLVFIPISSINAPYFTSTHTGA
jgi:hypothetical protein